MCMRDGNVTLSEAKGTMLDMAPLTPFGVTTGTEPPVSRID
jgi:hypothetical protein